MRFTAKFPKIITHDKRLKYVDKELDRFFEAIRPLADKTLALLIQLPASLHIFEGLERLRDLVPELDTKFRYAVEVEVRHASWFGDLAYNFFVNNDISMVWSQLADLQTPPILTTNFLYLKFIGDRSMQEKELGRIQIDRVLEMQKWAENIKKVQDERIKLAIIAANHHYAGFGPCLEFGSTRVPFLSIDVQIDFCDPKDYVDVMDCDLSLTSAAIKPDICVLHTI